MLGLRIPMGRPVAPFGDLPRDLFVLGTTLGGSQARALASAGVQLREGTPADAPWVGIGDHTWVTAPLVARFLQACPPTGGQLAIGGAFLDYTAALQDLPDGRVPLWLVPGGPADASRLRELPAIRVDLDVREVPPPDLHPVFAGVARPLPATDAMAHTIAHWTHLLRVNLLALVALAEGERRRVEASRLRKAWALLTLFWRAESLDRRGIEAATGWRGRGCEVHPTAVVEASILGEGVSVGPFAVVRHSWIGDGATIAEHARVVGSVVGPRATVAHGSSVQLCVLLPGAWVSRGNGHQVCVFGEQSFVAEGVTTYDLSFGGEVKVAHGGERVESGSRFLGSAIGHRARIGAGVRLGYGEAVPSDALLVAEADTVARRIPERLGEGAHVVREGRLVRAPEG